MNLGQNLKIYGAGGTAISHSKELLSLAYIQSLCAVTGLNYNEPVVDNDGVDITIRGKMFSGFFPSPKIELQLKCTDVHSYIDSEKDELVYPLKVGNYNSLVAPSPIPTILAIHFAPGDNVSWLQHSRFGLTLRYATYWVSLLGMPRSVNDTTVTVRVPLSQRLDSTSLLWLMGQASEGKDIVNGLRVSP